MDASLFPRHDGDMMRFVGLFACGRTACNYVSYVAYACTILRLSLLWRTPALQAALSGARKRTLRFSGVSLKEKFPLSTQVVTAMVSLAQSLQELQKALLFGMCFEFLLRVASEACKLHVGCEDDVDALPPGVEASIWLRKRTRRVALRLRTRKHRPQGSLMLRPCSCETTPGLCVYHLAEAVLEGRRPGELLWEVLPREVLTHTRRYMTLLGCRDAERTTLKSYRMGKASSLAAEGASLQMILESGEWRSKAVMSYLPPEKIDEMKMLQETLRASDSEDCPEESPTKRASQRTGA